MRRFGKQLLGTIVITLAAAAAWAAEPSTDKAYLFTYFREPNGNDGLHLAFSRDGLRWEPLGPAGHTWIQPTLATKCMRDPCLQRGPDGTFFLVWTTGWGDKGFGYASSKDLVRWSPQKWIPVNEKIEGAKNTWAPELFYDSRRDEWLIFWSTTIEGRFPETAREGHHNHRPYYVTTRDFSSFSKARLLFNPGYNTIDATLIEFEGRYHLIYKDERPGKKQLHVVSADSPTGPWGPPSLALPKPGRMVEGPSALRVGDAWLVYFDVYTDHHYGAVRSRDLLHWDNITPHTSFPRDFRHGTALEISPQLLASLQAAAQRSK